MTEAKKDEKTDAEKAQAKQEAEDAKAAQQEADERQAVIDDPEASDEEKRAAELAGRNPDVGVDGVNPITPNNPPKGSQPSTSRPRD